MSTTYELKPLVGAHYPERTFDGRMIARSEPPVVAVLIIKGALDALKNDEPTDGQDDTDQSEPIEK